MDMGGVNKDEGIPVFRSDAAADQKRARIERAKLPKNTANAEHSSLGF